MKAMQFFFLLLVAISVIVIGCTGKLEASSSKEGYILEKKEGRILVVQEISQERYNDIKDVSSEALIDQGGLKLIWLTYDNVDQFKKGDHVVFWLEGPISESYPEQGRAKKVEAR
jgi:hypothetical protein